MNKYTFRNNNGDVVTVEAIDEKQARTYAMEKLWGPATGMYAKGYEGRGLAVVTAPAAGQ